MLLSGAHQLGIWGLTACLAVITVFFHIFILLHSVRRAQSSHHWTPSEVITSALAFQSILQQFFAVFWMSMVLMDPQCIVGRVAMVLEFLLLGVRSSVLWSTAFLLFNYSTKLVIEPVHCYTRAQELILRHVRPAVVLIPVCCLCFYCPLLVTPIDGGSCNSTSMLSEDHTTFYPILHLILSDVLPGVVVLKASISIAVHLALHLRHLRSSTNGFHGPKLGAELHVMRMCLAMALGYLLLLAVEIYVLYLSLQLNDMVLLTALFSSLYTAICGAMLTYGKESVWDQLLHLYNLTLDRYPGLTCLKAPEKKADHGAGSAHGGAPGVTEGH